MQERSLLSIRYSKLHSSCPHVLLCQLDPRIHRHILLCCFRVRLLHNQYSQLRVVQYIRHSGCRTHRCIHYSLHQTSQRRKCKHRRPMLRLVYRMYSHQIRVHHNLNSWASILPYRQNNWHIRTSQFLSCSMTSHHYIHKHHQHCDEHDRHSVCSLLGLERNNSLVPKVDHLRFLVDMLGDSHQ